MPRICAFDVNETLLDLRALDPDFESAFGDVAARQAWFTQLIQTAFVTTIIGTYRDFGTIGATALEVIATRRGVTLAPQMRISILTKNRHLPPHPDENTDTILWRECDSSTS